MDKIFPSIITDLPEADVPIDGVSARLFQGEKAQILFMQFEHEASVPEHSHEAQWGVILNGVMEITIDGIPHTYKKGDSYYIPKDVNHSSKVSKDFADVTFFNQADRYKERG